MTKIYITTNLEDLAENISEDLSYDEVVDLLDSVNICFGDDFELLDMIYKWAKKARKGVKPVYPS